MTNTERYTLEYLINRIEWEKEQHDNESFVQFLDKLIKQIKAKL